MHRLHQVVGERRGGLDHVGERGQPAASVASGHDQARLRPAQVAQHHRAAEGVAGHRSARAQQPAHPGPHPRAGRYILPDQASRGKYTCFFVK